MWLVVVNNKGRLVVRVEWIRVLVRLWLLLGVVVLGELLWIALGDDIEWKGKERTFVDG